MRFLFECVGCYTLNSPSTDDGSSMPPVSKSDETRSLVAAPQEMSKRRKRSSPRSHGIDWRPSLFAIAEDYAIHKPAVAVAESVRHRGAAASTAVVKRSKKRCGSSLGGVGASRSHTRDHRYGHDPVPIVVPAFSAPFLF